MPSRLEVTPGERFGRLTIVKEVEQWHKRRSFLCRCDCGNIKVVNLAKLRSGNTQSCGCYQAESRKLHTKTHGYSKTRIYRIWAGIKERCLNPKNHIFKYYGGRGISVCDEWLEFEPFLKWALKNGYKNNLTIERKDFNGNYEPSNCTWIPSSEQNGNTRKTIRVNHNGQTKSLKEWSRILGFNYLAIYKRIYLRGWTVEKAFTTPVQSPKGAVV